MSNALQKNIIWLASYPKSGNTWFRAFLSALLSGKEVNINRLSVNHSFADHAFFNQATQLNASELPESEVNVLKPLVAKYLSANYKKKVFVKIHEKFFYPNKNHPIIPIDHTLEVIYLIRNPLDIAISFAHFSKLPIDNVVSLMNHDYTLNKTRNGVGTHLIPERLGTWSEHVNSWTKNKEIMVHVVRYEDLSNSTFGTFKKAVEAIGLEYSDDEISMAIEACSFEKLKSQEAKHSFKEKYNSTNFFFRKGKAGSWRDELNPKQIDTIINNHYDIMASYGYIP